jgi:predicted nucleic acid-binding Zn finger protein
MQNLQRGTYFVSHGSPKCGHTFTNYGHQRPYIVNINIYKCPQFVNIYPYLGGVKWCETIIVPYKLVYSVAVHK